MHYAFLTPRGLPKAHHLAGRVAVLDIAFDNLAYDKTKAFIAGLGARLAAWVDHHDHARHADYADDERFVLATKAQHGACPEMVTAELVQRTGPVDTIAMHGDLDGIYAGAKWALKGREPYPGADDDARAVDTRIGEPSERAQRIDRALRARMKDDTLKLHIVHYLTGQSGLWPDIEAAARLLDPLIDAAQRLATGYDVRGGLAYIRASGQYDKTELLLLGQRLAPVALVHDGGQLAIAADFRSGLDFLQIFDLPGGMPTRISLPEIRLEEALTKLRGV